MPNLTFNILTFKHPEEKYTFYFADKEKENLNRIYHTHVPDEVIEHLGQQEHYYTSFDKDFENSLPVTKNSSPSYSTITNEDGEEVSLKEKNTCFSISILKRFYNLQIQTYFKNLGYLIKPNFVEDTEIWLPSTETDPRIQYNFFERFTLKVQFGTVTNKFELLITYAGKPKAFQLSVADLIEDVAPECFNWVIYNNWFYKFEELPEKGKRNHQNVYPIWNFKLRDALYLETEAPEKGNRYHKFKTNIYKFRKDFIDTDVFNKIIPISDEGFVPVDKLKIGRVGYNSNKLLFGNQESDIIPMNGMKKHGPYDLSTHSKIHFFFIFYKDDLDITKKIDRYFKGIEFGFKGLYKFIQTYYHTEKNFSISFEDKNNPLPEIEQAIRNKHFEDDVQYIAIYVSPFSKHGSDKKTKSLYYKIKELLLKEGIPSQVLEAEKILTAEKYHYSLPNIAIAILAKLNGVPWKLDTKLKNELIVGVGAFKNSDTAIQYIGSAFSFSNNGKFNRFECFRKNQTIELAGSIIRAVKEYVAVNSGISRLVIHFYKNMGREELEPIEEGLKDLGLEIPVFIVSINKTESKDIVAFDENWKEHMPISGTYINIGFNKFLLFNNTRYSENTFNRNDGFPFPIKLNIYCSDKELSNDYKLIKELIDQVYQFSRMYWKSVRQQNLPVTIKYPEMVAEMVPHFEGDEIPDFGKDTLWFL